MLRLRYAFKTHNELISYYWITRADRNRAYIRTNLQDYAHSTWFCCLSDRCPPGSICSVGDRARIHLLAINYSGRRCLFVAPRSRQGGHSGKQERNGRIPSGAGRFGLGLMSADALFSEDLLFERLQFHSPKLAGSPRNMLLLLGQELFIRRLFGAAAGPISSF